MSYHIKKFNYYFLGLILFKRKMLKQNLNSDFIIFIIFFSFMSIGLKFVIITYLKLYYFKEIIDINLRFITIIGCFIFVNNMNKSLR